MKPNQVAMVTYYKQQKNPAHKVHYKKESFNFLKYSLTNIAKYCQDHGIAFFFQNAHLVDTDSRAAYWGKMDVLRYYFEFGYDWIIWTDVDVLFWNNEKSIINDWLNLAEIENKHVALVKECSYNVKNASEFGKVRSGFLAIKNSDVGKRFLDAWGNSFEKYEKKHNPDQEALENLVEQQEWKDLLYITNPNGIHTYPHCQRNYDHQVISVHYPGPLKSRIIKDAIKLRVLDDGDFFINMDV